MITSPTLNCCWWTSWNIAQCLCATSETFVNAWPHREEVREGVREGVTAGVTRRRTWCRCNQLFEWLSDLLLAVWVDSMGYGLKRWFPEARKAAHEAECEAVSTSALTESQCDCDCHTTRLTRAWYMCHFSYAFQLVQRVHEVQVKHLPQCFSTCTLSTVKKLSIKKTKRFSFFNRSRSDASRVTRFVFTPTAFILIVILIAATNWVIIDDNRWVSQVSVDSNDNRELFVGWTKIQLQIECK